MSYLEVTGFREMQGKKKYQIEMVFETVGLDEVLEESFKKAKKIKVRDLKICKCCGNSFTPNHGRQDYCSDKCKKKARSDQSLICYYKKRDEEKKAEEIRTGQVSRRCSLCCDCKNIVPNPVKKTGCSWSINFVPVKGWEAIKTKKGTYESYKVLQCPRYVEG